MAKKKFDPYYTWLAIPPAEQPPSLYRLLGLALFEDDPEVISNLADQWSGHVKTFQSGKHSEESQRLLNEIASARLCLLDPKRKTEYDTKLREQMRKQAAGEEEDVQLSSELMSFLNLVDNDTGNSPHDQSLGDAQSGRWSREVSNQPKPPVAPPVQTPPEAPPVQAPRVVTEAEADSTGLPRRQKRSMIGVVTWGIVAAALGGALVYYTWPRSEIIIPEPDDFVEVGGAGPAQPGGAGAAPGNTEDAP